MQLHQSIRKMKNGLLEYCILELIFLKQTSTHQLSEALLKHELILREGAIYPILHQLKHRGYVNYESKVEENGLQKKTYRLTEEGENVRNSLHQIMQNISQLEDNRS